MVQTPEADVAIPATTFSYFLLWASFFAPKPNTGVLLSFDDQGVSRTGVRPYHIEFAFSTNIAHFIDLPLRLTQGRLYLPVLSGTDRELS